MSAAVYFWGFPCKHGHVSARYISSKACCQCEHLKHQKYKKANVDKVKAQGAAWRAANPSYKSPNEAKASAAYYENNKETCLRRTGEYRRKNLAAYARYRRTRRARAKAAPGSHTEQDIIEIFQMQKGRCAYCREKVSLDQKHVDHIQPLAKGGHNGRSNLQILCESCNVRKNAIDPVDFARRIGRLI